MKPLPPDQWDPSLQHIIDAMDGDPINIHCLLANHPPLLNAWWVYRMYLVTGGDLKRRHAEIVILRVAVHMKAWYEWAAHVDRGLAAGLSIEEIERVAAGPNAAGWNAQDAALLRGVDALINSRCLENDLRDDLESYFTEQQLLDVISIQGLYVTIASMIGTWPIELEDALKNRLPAHITEDSFAELISAANSN
jgi:4-carboxymuconolactone decarboxylase